MMYDFYRLEGALNSQSRPEAPYRIYPEPMITIDPGLLFCYPAPL